MVSITSLEMQPDHPVFRMFNQAERFDYRGRQG